MTEIKVEKLNEAHLRFFCEDFGVEAEIVDYFTFEVPGAKYTPKYKAKIWDGKIRLADPIRRTLYVGLWEYLQLFANERGYTVTGEDIGDYDTIEPDQVESFVSSLNIHSKGNSIEIRDYQLDAIHIALSKKRGVLVSPTGSGKSAIIYCITRWLLEEEKKIMVVVPTTSLVEQMYSDFQDYSSDNGWSTDENCQKLYSGFSKKFERNVLFTTWQSIYQLPKEWFSQFDVVIGDEAHQFKSKSLTTIMNKMTEVKYRIGTTGSLDDKKVHKLVLEGLFGKIYRVTTTKKLQDAGSLADLRIKALLVKHPDDIRKVRAKMKYQDEIDYLVTLEKRNKFIKNIAKACKGNTLVLFNFVEKQGKPLYNMIKESVDGRSVYFIHGNVDVDERERIRHALSSERDAIVVASFGTTSTGINVPSIENIIFASPSKSIIRVLQSIGRGLRLNHGKTHCTLYDISDDLSWKSAKNHTLKHGAERFKIYTSEEFNIKLIEVSL